MRKKLSRTTALLFAMIFSIGVSAQSFYATVDDMTKMEATITKTDGTVVSGKIKTMAKNMRGISAISIIDAEKIRYKFKATDITKLVIPYSKLDKLLNDNLLKINSDEVAERTEIIFEQVKMPKKEKFTLMQILNPHFADKVKVYYNPFGESGGSSTVGPLTIGKGPASYFIVKNGITMNIRDKKYKKEGFAALFGDCEDMMTKYDKKNRKFSDIEKHIVEYNGLCN